MMTVTIRDAQFRATFARLRDSAKRPRAILAAAGRAAANALRRHFRERDAVEVNKLGGKRTHFWLQVMRSVQAPISDDQEARISINHPGIAQKVFGGTITAKRVKNLAIPQTPEAYGRAPAVFEQETGLKLFCISGRGAAVLATRRGAVRGLFGAETGLQVEYVLKPSVTQDATPGALPEMGGGSAFTAQVVAAAQAAWERQWS